MRDAKWKDALWKLLQSVTPRRIGARVALSAGLIGLAAQSAPSPGAAVRLPVSPVLAPEATVRKFKGRYVLRRAANALSVHLAQHRSHSSHSSHASHASHQSSSHYSGSHSSHFSSSPSPSSPSPAPPSPQPTSPRSLAPRAIAEPADPTSILREDFAAAYRLADRWRIGVLATPAETFDSNTIVEQTRGVLRITPGEKGGSHFNGYVSVPPFDLTTCSITVHLRSAAADGTTIVAAAIDAANWIGFRVEGGELAIESHTNGRVAARKTPYRPAEHRFLRLRTSKVAPVVVWETSAEGTNWNPQYVETSRIGLNALHIALSAGRQGDGAAGAAAFESVRVEAKP